MVLVSKYSRYDPLRNNLLKIAAKSFLLGAVTTGAVVMEFSQPQCIPVCIYIQCLCLFHSLEFVATYVFNNTQVDDDSFILEDKEFHMITALSLLEHWLTPEYLKIPTVVRLVGLLSIASGQIARTLSMYTARESFNHYVQQSGKKSHTLVTTGIYSYIRHPSYFGFFVWFIGMELLLRNVATLAIGSVILWKFFKDRIRYEEKFLINMFQDSYIKYRATTRTWMLIE
ncbi:uncharacterized protein LODBEIA_P43440 [Lodderomyces beijingensis]|uniref:Protein-S-isoprenylcysteine O-methyltransferase n=1 Tax=Lodderomyces beijingensis TaxID=1775926 RepID=A0ABP0ZPP4_9ASCO